ncbi:PREDICTED: uncharacterized protein LOC109156012 [Ipomoea nil]|uniref:uncharacterized protein LOC109156012 n=1 Tax=Ipomoea nil TaxID=35883 RepID=UPI00090096A3|nr:PREDICTED: uncharacterized protein LOC109156012 [Ipomoea nil]
MIDAAGAKLWWNFRRGESIWSQFVKAKYCNEVHPVARGWNYKDSHVWRRMVEVREKVEPEIQWDIRRGNLNVWWDNWSGKGALAIWLNRRGKRKAKDMLKDGWINGALDLNHFGIQDQSLAQNIRIREGADKPRWKPTGGGFNFKSAKGLMRQHRNREGGLWCKKIWNKGITWKMSFLAWRVFKKKLPVDDVLRKMGYQTVSKCPCCVKPGCDTLQHIFGMGDTAHQVWDYFSRAMGARILIRSERHVCYEWWMMAFKNRMFKFMADRLPILILWELWVNYTHCKYGKGKPSVTRIIFKVTKDLAECIQRKWPAWDPLPPNFGFIMKRAESFGYGKIVQRTGWCRPRRGSVKVNWAIEDNSCGFFIRNSRGMFCVAGVYSFENGEDIQAVAKRMLRDCWNWGCRNHIRDMCFESDKVLDWEYADQVNSSRTNERVNAVARCLTRMCAGMCIWFLNGCGLPRGLDRVLALEGIPHFVLLPGMDALSR